MECQVSNADYLQLGVCSEEEVYENEAAMEKTIKRLERDMKAAGKALEFERAAKLRDQIRALRQKELQLGGSVS